MAMLIVKLFPRFLQAQHFSSLLSGEFTFTSPCTPETRGGVRPKRRACEPSPAQAERLRGVSPSASWPTWSLLNHIHFHEETDVPLIRILDLFVSFLPPSPHKFIECLLCSKYYTRSYIKILFIFSSFSIMSTYFFHNQEKHTCCFRRRP